jgi:hypothetical protein
MEKLIKIRQYHDGNVTVEDDIEGTDRSRSFPPENRDGFAETVAHLLSDLDQLVPRLPVNQQSVDVEAANTGENPITEQTKDAAE